MILPNEPSLQFDEITVPPQYLIDASACILDAGAQFKEVYNSLKQQWEKQIPGVILELSDALQLQPAMAHLTSATGRQQVKQLPFVLQVLIGLNNLPVYTGIDTTHLSRAIKSVNDAILLLQPEGINIADTNEAEINSILGTQRLRLAASMIIENFFQNINKL